MELFYALILSPSIRPRKFKDVAVWHACCSSPIGDSHYFSNEARLFGTVFLRDFGDTKCISVSGRSRQKGLLLTCFVCVLCSTYTS